MTLRLTPEQDKLLTELAARQGISKQEAAVRAIEKDAEERSRVILNRIVAEDAELLDLLAK